MVQKRSAYAPLLSTVALFLAGTAFAQTSTDTSTVYWPEFDLYERVNKNVRLVFMGRYQSGDPDSYVVGGFVDLYVPRFTPVIFRDLAILDESRSQRIILRLGYRHYFSQTPENRIQTDGTLRWGLRGRVLMSDRNRFDFRFMEGDFSWRYRNEPRLEHDFRLGRIPITPYIAAEIFYDSKYDTVDRWRYIGGTVFTLGSRWSVEPYYMREVNKHPELSLTNIIGLKVSFFGP